MTASNRCVPAKVFATSGISNAPGTRTTSMSSGTTPCFVSPSTQLLNSLLVTNLLNLETTIPNFNPVSLLVPLRSFMQLVLSLLSSPHPSEGGGDSPKVRTGTTQPPDSNLFENVP